MPASTTNTTYDEKTLEQFLSFVGVSTEDALGKCVLTNIADGCVLVELVDANKNKSYQLYNSKLLKKLNEEYNKSLNLYNGLLDIYRGEIGRQYSNYITLKNGIYEVDHSKLGGFSQNVKKALEYICVQLSSSEPPPSLDQTFSTFFFSRGREKPATYNRFFQQNVSIVVDLLSENKPKPPQDIFSRKILKPIQENGENISGENVLAIYLQACQNFPILLEQIGNENSSYLEDYVSDFGEDAANEISTKFAELITGDHLAKFLSGELKLSDPEKEFLAQMKIIPNIEIENILRKKLQQSGTTPGEKTLYSFVTKAMDFQDKLIIVEAKQDQSGYNFCFNTKEAAQQFATKLASVGITSNKGATKKVFKYDGMWGITIVPSVNGKDVFNKMSNFRLSEFLNASSQNVASSSNRRLSF